MALAAYESDPRLFLFTSLTAGSSHIITATSRLETILKANKIPFQAIDLATDESARRLWQRRGQGKKLPGLVKEGFVVGDLEQIEEWNEFGELKENIGPVPAHNNAPASTSGSGIQGVNIRPPEATSPSGKSGVPGPGVVGPPKSPIEGSHAEKSIGAGMGIALPGAAEIKERAAAKAAAKEAEKKKEGEGKGQEKEQPPANAAKALLREEHPGVEHLSAPPSGAVTPAVAEAAEADVEKAEEGKAEDAEGEAGKGKESVEHTRHESTIQWADEQKEGFSKAEVPKTEEEAPAVAAEKTEAEDPVEEKVGEASETKATPLEPEQGKEADETVEEAKDDTSVDEVTKGVEATQVDDKDTEMTQEQDAKAGEDATKSVKD